MCDIASGVWKLVASNCSRCVVWSTWKRNTEFVNLIAITYKHITPHFSPRKFQNRMYSEDTRRTFLAVLLLVCWTYTVHRKKMWPQIITSGFVMICFRSNLKGLYKGDIYSIYNSQKTISPSKPGLVCWMGLTGYQAAIVCLGKTKLSSLIIIYSRAMLVLYYTFLNFNKKTHIKRGPTIMHYENDHSR